MIEGGCLCGAVRFKYTGEVTVKALCHCLDCHKITGSMYSTNMVAANDAFSVTKGVPKEFCKKADSGEIVKLSSCADCGSTLWSESPSFGDTKVIKAGTLDSGGALEEAKPRVEIFVRSRPSWLRAVPGAAQYEGAYS